MKPRVWLVTNSVEDESSTSKRPRARVRRASLVPLHGAAGSCYGGHLNVLQDWNLLWILGDLPSCPGSAGAPYWKCVDSYLLVTLSLNDLE